MADINDQTQNPFTGSHIEQVSPSQWTKLTINKLYDQLIILERRVQILNECDAPQSTISQVQLGILKIKSIIKEKEHGVASRSTRKRRD